MIVKNTGSHKMKGQDLSKSINEVSDLSSSLRAQMPMISIFTLIHAKARRPIIMLSHQCCRLGFLARCIAIFLSISHPTAWRDRFMITGLCHFSLTYG